MAEPVIREEVRDAFLNQAVHCDDLGSPFTAELCRTFAQQLDDGTAIGRLINGWSGRVSHRADAVPLRLCGGLHRLVLGGKDDELAAHYPPHSPVPSPWPVLKAALDRHETFLTGWMASPPQTNEVRRANAIWPVLQWIATTTERDLALWEIGASAGLNLQMDRFCFRQGGIESGDVASAVVLEPDWKGAPAPGGTPRIVEREGCDINPLDPAREEDRMRLLSYLWADQAGRVSRTKAAIDLAKDRPIALRKQDAVAFLADALPNRRNDVATVIYTTIAWQYLTDEDRARADALFAEHAVLATEDAPLARVHMEGDGNAPGAAISVQLWPHGIDALAGRVDFHGRWVDWHGIEN